MTISPPKVQSLYLKNFTAFEKAYFEFCPGINVLIGANATGKSHVMKVIYTLLKVCEAMHQPNPGMDTYNMVYAKFYGVFQPNKIHNLIHGKSHIDGLSGIPHSWVNLSYNDVKLALQLDMEFPEARNEGFVSLHAEETPDEAGKIVLHSEESLPKPPPLIYLPAREFLSINPGFIDAYNKRELSFDETYYDLSLALNALPLRKDKLGEMQEAIATLKEIIGGSWAANEEIVHQQNGMFYLYLPEGNLEIHLVAEGYRKIATLYYLLRNGSLSKDSILFWDEPEANLNPKLIVEVVKVLQMLAATGMQIFITTHDYLLSQELSLLAEYPAQAGIDLKFFALHRPDRRAGVQVEAGQTLAEIQHNPILEEFAAHYDRESTLFYQTTP
jgi:energy-coupling factor transporter ATP-binding protein EcfA2